MPYLLPALAAALALLAAGCGSSDGGDSSSTTSGTAEQQARATVDALYAAIRKSDAEGVCEQLAEAAQKQIADGGLGKRGGTCAESFQGFLDQAEKSGGLDLTLKAKVRKVVVNGDTAAATVTFGKGRKGDIPLEKVDGVWKLGAVGATPSR